MLIRTQQDGFIHPLSSEITSSEVYANRRQLLRQWSAGAAAIGMGSWAQREAFAQGGGAAAKLAALPAAQAGRGGGLGQQATHTHRISACEPCTWGRAQHVGLFDAGAAVGPHALLAPARDVLRARHELSLRNALLGALSPLWAPALH